MAISEDQYIALLSEVEPESLIHLYKKTLAAIITIAAAYVSGIIFLTAMLLLKSDYYYFALLFPLLGYIWMTSLGAKHVNNRYGFKKTVNGTVVYTKKRQSYSTFASVHAIIFIFSSIARLVYEIRNSIWLKKEVNRNGSADTLTANG